MKLSSGESGTGTRNISRKEAKAAESVISTEGRNLS